MHFDPKSVAIIVNTSYPKWYKGKLRSIRHLDKVRGDLALEFVRHAKELGYQAVIVDGKSSKTFYKELSGIEQIRVIRRRAARRSPNKRIGIKIASKIFGIKVIVSSEPEKLSILDSVSLIVRPILEGQAEIVVPKRDTKLFESTHPRYMYESETEANKLYNEILRTSDLLKAGSPDLDMFFGPRAFSNDSRIMSLFMKKYHILSSEYFDSEEWSNTLYFPIVLALKKGLRVKNVVVPFSYPKIQKENEEKLAKDVFFEKRKAQRLGLLVELLH